MMVMMNNDSDEWWWWWMNNEDHDWSSRTMMIRATAKFSAHQTSYSKQIKLKNFILKIIHSHTLAQTVQSTNGSKCMQAVT
jgi:hypothetical protein